MPGQATITVNGNTWAASVMTTSAELLAGLSGVASIPVNTGMLFDMGSEQSSIAINTTEMLFNLDILFINDAGLVVGILSDVEPGESASGKNARYFLEVNAGELADVGIGDSVVISGYTPSAPSTTGIDIGQIVVMMIAVMMMGMMMKFAKD